MGTAPVDTSTLSCSRKSDRKQLRARRRDPAGVRSKITRWFDRQPSSPATQRTPSLQTTPQNPDQQSTPKSLVHAKMSLEKKNRSRGCRKNKKQATIPTPLLTPEESTDLASDGSPALQPRLPFRRVMKPKNSTQTLVPGVVKTTASSQSKAMQHASSQEVKQATDRKRNLDG